MKAWGFLTAIFLAVVSPGVAQEPTWTQKFPATSPSGRYATRMAYDAVRQQMVLFGGANATNNFLGDTWVWDGVNWTQQFPVTSPPGRGSHATAYDAARQRVVLFGGSIGPGLSGIVADTWEWDGTNWAQKFPATSPSPRLHAGMAYDEARQQVVLFGGSPGSPTGFADTWVWDGTNWTQKFPATSPPARAGSPLAYDTVRGQTVLFGGTADGVTFFNDTWVWDGATWTQKFPATSPSPRVHAGMAYDKARQQVVLFGGANNPITLVLGDTWVWDGVNWTQKFPATSPAGRHLPAMAYDDARTETALFGGFTGSFYDDTWVWGTSFAAQVQQPINSDGSSIFNAKRGVVPVKFILTVDGAATCDLPPATISLTRTSGATPGPVDESVYVQSSDSGSNFRISSCQYVYNLGTSPLGVGTYQVNISIGATAVGTATFGLD
jgi:galactose oxidase-like protein